MKDESLRKGLSIYALPVRRFKIMQPLEIPSKAKARVGRTIHLHNLLKLALELSGLVFLNLKVSSI